MSSREPCQIRVILVEGRGLKSKEGDSDLPNPAVRVNLIAGPVKKSQRSNIYTDVSSVYFNETKIFEEDIGRDEFDEGRIQIQVEDDQGLFTPRLIGEHSFDLAQVYAASSHEFYNKWCVLLHPDKGGEIQGFMRVCIIALKKGDAPKTHTKTELEDDHSSSGSSVGMVASEGIVELDRKQLILRFYKAEVGTYRQACPDAQVRVLFAGTKPLKSGVVKQNYNPQFNDELLVPIFLPTFADIITIQLINKGDDEAIMAQTTLSLLKIRSEDLEPTWLNMYGPRPAPPSLQQEAQNAKDMIERTLVKVSAGAIPERLVSPEVDSAWRARLLVYASIEDTGPREPKLQRMPMILSASMLEDLEPETEPHLLRCDLFEAVGWSLPPASALYLVLAWGPTERKSKSNTPAGGKIIFESPLVSKTGYYELLDQIETEQPANPDQQYDIFLHIYVATPLGDRRLGFKQFGARQLTADSGWSITPQWFTFTPDFENMQDVSMHTAMIQLRLLYGLKKDVEKIEPKRVHEKIPKLMRFDLSANIFQGRDMQPADSNGLADPYVKIIACGVERETAVIERTLQPIWYQRLSIPLDLPRDLTLAPKVALLVFDSDPILGMSINKGSDPIIGFALCPPEHDEPQNPDGTIKEPRSMKEYFVRSGLGEPEERKPEWIDVYSIEGMEQMALFKSDPTQHDKPANVGSILVDFELRPEQEAKKLEIKDAELEAAAKKAAAKEAKEGGGGGGGGAPAFPMVKVNNIRSMPKMIRCYLEVALIGVRDMKPRTVAGFQQAISAPYIEFEYGHRSAPERYWKTKTMLAGGGGDSSAGPNANFLEVIYLQVLLPDDPTYDPVMGVRVRDTPAVQLLPGPMADDPICGVCAIHIKSKMPSFARYEEQRLITEEAEEVAKLLALQEEDARKEAEGVVEQPDAPEASNEEIVDELVFESTAMAKGAKGKAGAGKRSVAGPDATELDGDDEDSDDDDDSEDEDEDGGSAKDPIITHTMESTLKDVPFEAHHLHMGAIEPGLGEIGIRQVGVLKLKVRVIEEDTFVETIKESPAPSLKKIFREEMTKVRIHCYWATNLSSRPDGKAPAPFLKVYNGAGGHQVKTGKVMDNTINPEFWTSFELAAMLPGQAILHVELWDYTLLKESLIGGTTIDLEDRYYSQKWKEMQAMGKMPRELRQLTNETSSNVQGNIIMKLEIFPVAFARANPLEQLAPPKKTQFELRVVIWEAEGVATKDGGQSDVFVTIQPRGEAEYEKQSTDTHWFSTGEAEFNWRMIWPLFLPEKVPRLFMQVWDQDIIGADDAIGEAELNLKPMLDKVLKKGAGAKQDGMWINTTHPNFKGVQARIRISLEVCTVAESIIKPAGNRRDAPNENPFLEMPIRPGLFDGLGLSFKFFNPMMLFMKYRVKCCICCIIIGVVAALVLYMSM